VNHPRGREFILLAVVAAVFVIGFAQLGTAVAIPFFGFLAAFGAVHLGVRLWAPNADPVIVPIAGFLVAVGSMQLASIDKLQAQINSDYKPLAPLQTGWLIVGAAVFLATVYVFRNGLGPAWRYRYTLALIGLVTLLAPLIPKVGYTIRGARLWVRLGPLSFQPGSPPDVESDRSRSPTRGSSHRCSASSGSRCSFSSGRTTSGRRCCSSSPSWRSSGSRRDVRTTR
jgi:hypothetical protein